MITEEIAKLIAPGKVERDIEGYWSHPHLPKIEGEEETWSRNFRVWADTNGFEIGHSWLESEDEEHEAYVAYFEHDEPGCALWNPPAPIGEGWFLIGIWECEDGPAATFLRQRATTTTEPA